MTASLLFLIHGRRDGESGEARRDRVTPGLGRQRPYGTPGGACIRRTAERGNRNSHAPGRGDLQEGLNADRGRRGTEVRRALRPSLWGIRGDDPALRAVGLDRDPRCGETGTRCRTSLAFPLRTPPGVPGPRLPTTLGGRRGEGQRARASRHLRLWTSLWTTPGQPVDNWCDGGGAPGEALWSHVARGAGRCG